MTRSARALRALPHALTLSNLLFGVAALGVLLVDGPLWQAGLCVGLALICDLFDGRAARRLGADGPFGAQLDSLADLVSFGVAPAVVLWAWSLHAAGPLGLVAAGAIVAAAATRLARFTVAAGDPAAHAEKPKGPARFQGLAVTIPAATLLGAVAADLPVSPRAAAFVALGLAALMVSSFPYRSFKDRSALLVIGPAATLCGLAVLLTGTLVEGLGLAFALGGAAYALSAPTLSLIRRFKR